MERMCTDHVVKVAGRSFDVMNKDYGSGYNAVESEWRLLLSEFDVARSNGMLVCLLAHARIRQAEDPRLGTFDQWTSLLGKKIWAGTRQWADFVGFASFDATIAKRE